jgi:large subunit ribosomal protein L22
MGARKRHSAEVRKEAKKATFNAKLYNNPTSPRKMRLVANLIRGIEVNKALNILLNTNREAAGKMYKLLLSAVSNWQSKNEGVRIEDSNLVIKDVNVDSGRVLKRLRTAPQGRGHRIKKRSNHINLVIDTPVLEVEETVEIKEKTTEVKVKSNKKTKIKE